MSDLAALDPVRFKQVQRESWNAAAPAWEKWWPMFDAGAQPIADRLVHLARIGEGSRVLDIATGTGEPAVTAARAVGPSGRVLATDQSPEMIAVAKRRAASLGLKNVEYRVVDAEALELGETGFDAVLCRWGLMFVADLNSTVAGIAKLLRKGGWFATSVWATADKVPMISIASDDVRKVANLPPPPPGTPDPLALADTNDLSNALTKAGFRDIEIERQIVNFEFDSPESFFQCRLDMSHAFGVMLKNLSAEKQTQIRNLVIAGARRYADSSGHVITPNEAIIFAAHI
ncbi:MAG TPA: class I SAM-dependent methyltransferase [Candidatus Binataceae bacterium]|nr:class I SAM-dependent methyltransferase [Candidatus Binataceae bacterium]